MNTLPAKPEPVQPTQVDVVPTWRELRERFRDVMKELTADISATWKKEGKELERELQSKLLPTLNRAKLEIEKLIEKLEARTKKPDAT